MAAVPTDKNADSTSVDDGAASLWLRTYTMHKGGPFIVLTDESR